jgi:hypothetical protein
MADPDRDEKLSASYRALGSEEPPPALDGAILAAARRRPTRLRVSHLRWRVPLSVAAVLVLAVGVTLRMLPERPDAESVALAPQVIETPRPAAPAPAREQPKPAARAAAAADVAAAGAAAESRAAAPMAAKPAAAPLTPEAWLARIAELRKQGRRREADESLAEFRKRYPGYRIPEPLR